MKAARLDERSCSSKTGRWWVMRAEREQTQNDERRRQMQINPIMKVDCLAGDASCPNCGAGQTDGRTGRTSPAWNAALNING